MSRAREIAASPYKGLAHFSERDAPFFFGREAERDLIVANLLASRLTLVYGESGVGKSSLLHAGVLRHLRELARRNLGDHGTPELAAVVFSAWRDDPLAALGERVRAAVGEVTSGGPLPELSRAGRLDELLGACAERLGGDVLVVLDQFEEYFLYHGEEDGDGTFATELPRALTRSALRANFLISIREDALAQLDRFKGRIPGLFENYLRIEHLDPDAARAAIERPIEQFNRLKRASERPVEIEPELVEAVLEQVQTGRVSLERAGRGGLDDGRSLRREARVETPFLQLVMARLWEEELAGGSRTLRLGTLDRLGGAERVVRTHLDAALAGLSPEEQELAAAAFHHLVTPGGTKIAHAVGDLLEYTHGGEAELRSTLEKLSGPDVRILRPVADSADGRGGTRYEIFHDVLAAPILEWRSRHVQAEKERELARQLEREERERREAQKRARVARATAVGLGLLLVGAAVLAVLAVRQRQGARAQTLVARSRAELAIDPAASVRLALDALDIRRTRAGETALRDALAASHVRAVLRGHSKWLNGAVFSPDGRRVLTWSADGTVRLWRAEGGAATAILRGGGAVADAAFSPGGGEVATAAADGSVRLWSASTGRPSRVLRGSRAAATSVAFSPNGRLLTSAAVDGSARIWDAASGRLLRPLRGHGDRVNDAEFDRDAGLVVTASDDGTARVWRVRDGRTVAVLVHDAWVNRASFAPRGRIVTASGDGTARVWDWRRGRQVRLAGHRGEVVDVAVGAGGRLVATAGRDGTARIWDAAAGRQESVLRGHTDAVESVAFGPDGEVVATASDDGTARLWSAANGAPLAELRGHGDRVFSVAFSRDGSRVVTASDDRTARVWDVRMGLQLRGHDGAVANAEFSPDGRLAVTAGADGTARVWNAETGRTLRILTGHDAPVNAAAFAPDGATVVTASDDGTARLWSVGTGRVRRVLAGHRDRVNDADFSRDGRYVVTAGDDATARVWVVATGRAIRTFHAGDYVDAASFSRDGKLVAAAVEDGTVRLWDRASGRRVAVLRLPGRSTARGAAFAPGGGELAVAGGSEAELWSLDERRVVLVLRGHEGSVRSVAFSPDGSRILTAGADGTTRVWDARSGEQLAALRRHADAVNSAVYDRSGRRILSAGDDRTARIYACETCAPLDMLFALAERREARGR